jgi:phosphate transport system substrate-binding protein
MLNSTRAYRKALFHPLFMLSLVGVAIYPLPSLATPQLPAYQPESNFSTLIESASNNRFDRLMSAWSAKFAKYHPQFRMKLRQDIIPRLTTTAVNTLIEENSVDIAPCAREPFPQEIQRFEKKYGYKPLLIAVATGAHSKKSGSHAQAIYVHDSNPINTLTLKQIKGVFTEQGRITQWGQLGLTGTWAKKPVNVYGLALQRPNGNPLGITNHYQKVVFDGDNFRADIQQIVDSKEAHMLDNIVERIAEDQFSIGYSGFGNKKPHTKTLKLARTDQGPFLEGTPQQVANHSYLLTRKVYFLLKAESGKALKPEVREFLKFILSENGQQLLTTGPEKYFPLPAHIAAIERSKLK